MLCLHVACQAMGSLANLKIRRIIALSRGRQAISQVWQNAVPDVSTIAWTMTHKAVTRSTVSASSPPSYISLTLSLSLSAIRLTRIVCVCFLYPPTLFYAPTDCPGQNRGGNVHNVQKPVLKTPYVGPNSVFTLLIDRVST